MGMIKNIAHVIVSPQDGWETVNMSDCRTQDLLSKAFYPLLGVLALSSFVPMIAYDHTITLAQSLTGAMIAFFSYFVTYFVAVQVLGMAFPELVNTKVASDRLSDYVLYNLIILVLVSIVRNILPTDFMPIAIMGFLYVPWVAYRGTAYLGAKGQRAVKIAILGSALMLGLPLFLSYVMTSQLIIKEG